MNTENHPPGLVVMAPRDYPDIRHYLSVAQMCALYDMSPETFYSMRTGPWLPDPDVLVGRQGGWAEERAVRWGRETGRLDEQGRPGRARRQGKPRNDEQPPAWYRVIPERYMSGQEAARWMGLNKDGMFRLVRRNDYPAPAVRIGATAARHVLGWTKESCLKFAVRRGYSLTPERIAEMRQEIREEAEQAARQRAALMASQARAADAGQEPERT